MVFIRNRLAQGRRRWARIAMLFALWAAVPHPLEAQEGGFIAEFCPSVPGYERICTEDALEVVFDSGTSTHAHPLAVGDEVPIRIVMDTRTPDIQGFSYAVKHDADVLSLERVTPEGTILDPESRDRVVADEHFNATSAVPGGFISAVVLAYREPREMPLGRNAICRASYRVAARPECSVIRIVHHQLRVPGSPPVSLNITVEGRSMQPETVRHGIVGDGPCREVCDDRADNDGDGLVDCRDPECPFLSCTGEEVCDDGVDNNLNGLVDCEDHRCLGKVPACPGPENCSDGIDNDFDGDLDCADAECAPTSVCREICQNGKDDDGDSRVDCEDDECQLGPACAVRELCDNGEDDDGNHLVDCADPGCAQGSFCMDCDEDGIPDAHDEPCTAYNEGPAEDCDDTVDNDGDGFVDELDMECSIPPVIPGAAQYWVRFIRGDTNGDGRIDVIDALILIRFVTGEEPVRDCIAALNANGDGGLDVSDAIPVLRWVFRDGPPLPHPFPACGSVLHEECNQPQVCPGP